MHWYGCIMKMLTNIITIVLMHSINFGTFKNSIVRVPMGILLGSVRF